MNNLLKRFAFISLMLVLIASFAGCNSSDNNSDNSDSDVVVEDQQEVEDVDDEEVEEVEGVELTEAVELEVELAEGDEPEVELAKDPVVEVVKEKPVIEPVIEIVEPIVEEPAVEVAEASSVVVSTEVQLAKCLTNKGVKLYTASWCGHCINQKEAFGDGLEYLDNTECAGESGFTQECRDAGVSAVPTWIFPGQDLVTGNRPLAELADLGGCTY